MGKRQWLVVGLWAFFVAIVGCGGGGGGGGGTPNPPPGTVPNAPTNVQTQALSATSVKITWTDASSDETGFAVERALGTGSFVKVSTSIAANTSRFDDTTAAAGTQYSYRVKAVNAAGESAPSNESVVTTPVAPTMEPADPSNLAATPASSSSITVTWTDNSDNEDNFKIDWALDNVFNNLSQASVVANVTSYLVTGLTANTKYYFRVHAVNGARFSQYSNTAEATTLSGGGTGPSWSTPAVISGSFKPTNSSPAFDSSHSGDGAAQLFWTSGTKAYHSAWNGSSWTNPAQVTTNATESIVPGIGAKMHLVKVDGSGDLAAQTWK